MLLRCNTNQKCPESIQEFVRWNRLWWNYIQRHVITAIDCNNNRTKWQIQTKSYEYFVSFCCCCCCCFQINIWHGHMRGHLVSYITLPFMHPLMSRRMKHHFHSLSSGDHEYAIQWNVIKTRDKYVAMLHTNHFLSIYIFIYAMCRRVF